MKRIVNVTPDIIQIWLIVNAYLVQMAVYNVKAIQSVQILIFAVK